MGILGWFRARRRSRLLAAHPIDDELWDWALKEHRILHGLEAGESSRLRELTAVFLAEKTFEALAGAEIDEELRLSVAAQACLPLLGLAPDNSALDWYRDFTTIMITPREYEVRKKDYDEAGVVHEYDDEFSGEAFDLGPVVLSKVDIEQSGWGDGYNVVIHEMAHKLDGREGSYDGCPPLHPDMDPREWRRVFAAAFEDFRARLNAPASRKPRRGRLRKSGAPRIDDYAAENPEEFFAVMCEYFFERPALLESEYPEVFGQLALFFGRRPKT